MIFEDRVDAGVRLAERLKEYKGPDVIVLAIPRGGVVVALEVALALDVPLDIVFPRKIGAPSQPELAIGAVTSDAVMLDEMIVSYTGASREYVEEEIARQRAEIERRKKLYREARPDTVLEGKTVILVDDGVATGYTTRAAIEDVRKKNPAKLVLAVPVAPPEAIETLRAMVDDLVVLEIPDPFYAVGSWYNVFDQTSDEEVIELLRRAESRDVERRSVA